MGLANYTAASNNNLFYAGAPGTNNLIFRDGTNDDQTVSAFKTRVAPRETNSSTENPPFLSIVGSSAQFLHIDPSIATQVEGTGVPIAGVTTDYDGDTRNASTPDLGADEGTFTPLALCTGTPAAGSITGTAVLCTGNTGTTLNFDNGSTDVGFIYQWAFSTVSGGPYTNLGTNPSQSTGALTQTTFYTVTTLCSFSGLTNVSPEFTLAVNPIPTASASSNGPLCVGDALNLTGTTDIGTNFSWTGPNGFTSGLQNPTIAAITAQEGGTYSLTVTAAGCSSTIATTSVTVNVGPLVNSITATPSTICSGGNSQLNVDAVAVVPYVRIHRSHAVPHRCWCDLTLPSDRWPR
ncbi:MAG: hypothetical protein V9F04_05285 [Dermatophilaceae bacterium]